MCIAIAKPAGVKITKRILKACFQSNPDGAGFAYPENGKVKIVKGLFSFRRFWREYREIDNIDLPMLIHFRIATSGQIDSVNCHPWRIDEQHVIVHNGNLAPKLKLHDEDLSDTGLFTATILKPIFSNYPDLWKLDSFQWAIEEAIGSGNKLAIMDADGEIRIFNEILGENEHGCWFSNKTYKEERIRKKKTNRASTTNSSTVNTWNSIQPYGPKPPMMVNPPALTYGPKRETLRQTPIEVAAAQLTDLAELY